MTPSPSPTAAAASSAAETRARAVPLVALVGNPNTGKTTLFNRLTGQRARVGNYPGVTVERLVSRGALGGDPGLAVDFLDIPGTYSLAARSLEERITLDALLGDGGPDLVVLVVDATQLSRNLYLAVQVLELRLRCVVALNMMDEVAGTPPDAEGLSSLLGAPVIPISAQRREGLEGLLHAARYALRAPPPPPPPVAYPPALESALPAVMAALPAAWLADAPPGRARALALWALSSLDDGDELPDIPAPLRAAVRAAHALPERDIDAEIVGSRYAFLDGAAEMTASPSRVASWTDRLDGVLLHPVWGFGVFVALMLLMFQSLFAWADPAIGLIEAGIEGLAVLATAALPPGLLTDLLVEGVIGGVGNVVVFLPQILLLFFFVGLMEDSGYMARAAYLMDRIMQAMGLHGRAFVPMLSGFACAVPAVMATRTLERRRDRLLTMMVVPLMTCSARLPVYTLLIGALFPIGLWGPLPVQGILMVGLYLFSVGISLLAAWLLGRTLLRGEPVPLLMELPPFRLPTLSSVGRMLWQRAGVFLSEAGTVILACTIALWLLLSFPRQDLPADTPPAQAAALQLERSYGGQLGKAIEPAIAPLGFDWKIGIGLIGSFAAREVFVSTMGLVYGVGEDVDEESASLRARIRAEADADGTPRYSPLVGMSLLVFFALACQCMSTLAVVKRETGGYAWPAFLFGYMTALAWVCSFLIYQGGRLLGLG